MGFIAKKSKACIFYKDFREENRFEKTAWNMGLLPPTGLFLKPLLSLKETNIVHTTFS